MSVVIYALCALTSLLCLCLLLRAYLTSGYRLLYWCAWCFSGLTLNNLLLMLDKIVLPDLSLMTLRLAVALLALLPLLYGLIFSE